MRHRIAIAAAVVVGCGNPPSEQDPPLVIGGPDCPELSCLPCGAGQQCAEEGPFIGETCCAIGERFGEIGAGEVFEVVDIETDGEFAFLCGGFGGRVFDIRDPANPVDRGSFTGRCQRIALGPTLSDGTRVFYAAHHGDDRAGPPFLSTYHLSPGQDATKFGDSLAEDRLYEGMIAVDDYLYVAAHSGGLLVYSIGASGEPTATAELGGFDNAWKLARLGDRLFVADEKMGVHEISIAVRGSPTRVGVYPTAANPRDIVLDGAGERLFVALGAFGFETFDISAGAPQSLGATPTDGSVQAIEESGGRLAIANWTHVSLLDAATFETLAETQIRGALEQTLGVAFAGDHVLAAEWGTGLHVLEFRPGEVGADLWLRDGFVSFRGDALESRAVIVENRGLVELDISAITTDAAAYELSDETLRVLPRGQNFFELTFDPEVGGGADATMTLSTNDEAAREAEVPLRLGEADKLKVGDALDTRFGFLDPNGAGQVESLDGKVVLLAYFGLF